MSRKPGKLRRAWRGIATVVLIVGIVAATLSLLRGPRSPPGKIVAPPANAQALSTSIEAWQAATSHERAAYVAWIAGSGLDGQRAAATALIEEASNRRTLAAQGVLQSIFLALSFASLLLVFLPLFVKHRRAPKRRALWLSSALCAAVLCVTFLFLLIGLNGLAELTSFASQTASLERGLVDATFDRLEAAALAESAAEDALPFGPTVGASEPGDDSMLANIWTNLQYFDPEAFKPAVVWSQRAWYAVRQLPHVIPFLIALVFLLTMRPLFSRLLRMPLQAGRGERRGGRRAIRAAAAFVGREWLAILVLAAVLVPVATLIQIGARHMSDSIVGIALGETRTFVEYFGHLTSPPEQPALTLGILALPAFLMIATGLSAMALGLFALWTRRITQMRFHQGIPLRSHGRFWRHGLLAMLRMQWIPVLLLWLLAAPLERLHAGGAADAADALGRLTQTSWWLGLGLVAAFLLFGGLRGVRYLVTFRPRHDGGRERTYDLRPSTPRDRDLLVRIHHEGLRPWIEAVWGWDEARQDDLTHDWLSRYAPDIVTVEGKSAGLLLVRNDGDAVNLLSVILLPRFQRLGFGARIVKDVVARAELRGVSTVLRVLKPNPAKRLYERLGFEVVDETETHYAMRREPG